MGRVDMRKAETICQRLPGQAGVPIVAIDQSDGEILLADPTRGVFHPFGDRFAERFLGNEFVAATRNADDPRSLGDLFGERLVFETPRQNVDVVAHAGEALREFQDVDDLATGVGFAKLRFGRDVAVGRDH